VVGVSGTCAISIDANKCSGHGRCYTLATDVFDMDDEGFPILLMETVAVNSDLQRQAQTAVDGCPERAISTEIRA
jgi:ferredoxin